MRGEHTPVEPVKPVIEGSSPRARGALWQHTYPDTYPRIIPACAGSTHVTLLTTDGTWDHPRVRGEHSGSMMRVAVL